MNYQDLRDSIDGLFAYDTGALDSGIKDEGLRKCVKDHLRSLPEDERRGLLAKLVVDLYLSEDAVKKGYGPEDAKDFLAWLDDNMDCLA